MKYLLVICVILCCLSLLDFPSGYYIGLRFFVTMTLITEIILEYKKKASWEWIIVFIVISIGFNPVFPVYLYEKTQWAPIDLLVATVLSIRILDSYKPSKIS